MDKYNNLPTPPSFKRLLGPSFIILALGLGSGEIILWPYLASNYGLGIAWGAVLGITLQYILNMEIERYALLKGESVFVGIHKMVKFAPFWFIFSTFIGFGLPGIIAASASSLASALGLNDFKIIAILMLLLIGLILSGSKTVYKTMEKITKTILILGIPFILLLTLLLTGLSDWIKLFDGIFGKGENYFLVPQGISIATFLAAFAYSGAGGNLNLTQSIYIKEKGYGMGYFSQKISGLFTSKSDEKIELAGSECQPSKENVILFQKWWKLISVEHFIVFLLLGCISMLVLMTLAYATTYGISGNTQGINFLINESFMIGQKSAPIVGTVFLVIVSIFLFQTQLGIMDSSSRIMSENLAIKIISRKKSNKINLSKIYFSFLWLQIAFGIILFLLNIYEPKNLIVFGAVINAFAMFIHVGLVFKLNTSRLDKVFQPSRLRKILMLAIFAFFGTFSFIVLTSNYL